MSQSKKAYEFITTSLAKGLTVFVCTPLKMNKVTPKNFISWEKSERKLFVFDDENNLRMARGKSYDIIATTNFCHVKLIAQ